MTEQYKQILDHLTAMYGPETAASCFERLQQTLLVFSERHPDLRSAPPPEERLTENDVILITYGDQIREPGRAPLQTLADVLTTTMRGVVSGVHILPFYPYTSDDGFSVVDYTVVDPQLGDWNDVDALKPHYRLMFDAVVNHISASSAGFQAFLRGEPGAGSRFIIMDPSTDLSLVTRPRTHPLLTPFETPNGVQHVWTTFSTDQIDLNFANPDIMLEMIDVLLLYVAHGASLIRLDAIGYLWKEVGTRSIHLPQTHRAVQLWRAVLDAVAPGVLLITETNVPHADNISYFGDGTNEAQMVYQFPLAPLTLNALHTGNARYLTEWAGSLTAPSNTTTFFNFLASHDGIGVVPATGILSPEEVAALVARTLEHGGHVSYKNNSDGSQSPYELNITLFDALSHPNDQADALKIDRFIAANAIMLALQGVPGIYVHSLIGSHNYHAGVEQTGRYRSINREKWERADLEQRLAQEGGHERTVFERFADLIAKRRNQQAFHPNGPQQIVDAGAVLFTLLRTSPDGRERVLCIHNVSNQNQALRINASQLGIRPGSRLDDIVGAKTYCVGPDGALELEAWPYQVLWLGSRS
jgi:sucrose phosphorylase